MNNLYYTRGCCVSKGKLNETIWRQCKSCQKLATCDSLSGMHNAALPTDIVEVRFKHTHKDFFKTNDLMLRMGDVVAVEVSSGHDIGIVSMTGDLAYYQMLRKGLNPKTYDYKKIYRKARAYDIEKWNEAVSQEYFFMVQTRKIASDLKLNMKISDVEIFADKVKAIFYYISDERVDFRELIKIMAQDFKLRIEMKQISERQEAAHIDGIGVCGRTLCCSSFLTKFPSVSVNAAKDQIFSSNMQKLMGQCSKPKCCLNYEIDVYADAQKDFPRHFATLETQDGTAYHHKTDIFKRLMWYNYDRTSQDNLIALSVERVVEILAANQKGEKVALPNAQHTSSSTKEYGYKSSVGEDNIARFDRKVKKQTRQTRDGGGRRGNRTNKTRSKSKA